MPGPMPSGRPPLPEALPCLPWFFDASASTCSNCCVAWSDSSTTLSSTSSTETSSVCSSTSEASGVSGSGDSSSQLSSGLPSSKPPLTSSISSGTRSRGGGGRLAHQNVTTQNTTSARPVT